MKIGVSLNMLQNAIDQSRLHQGQKGGYLDATVFIDIGPADKYGNHGMITQDVTKDEKAQGVKGNILGNCKVFWCDDNSVVLAGDNNYAPAPQAPAPQISDVDILVQYQQLKTQPEREAMWANLTDAQQVALGNALA